MIPELLQDWASIQAGHRPGATAVVSGSEQLTYYQLERLSNRIARSLKEHGCARGDRVCLLMPKSPLAVACILGIYKADCVYVPLDTSSPPARLARIVRACKSRMILTAGKVSSLLDELLTAHEGTAGNALGWLDGRPYPGRVPRALELEDVLVHSGAPVDRSNGPRDVAHLLFTSGSTGEPKGVMITHDNVIRFVDWAVRYFRISETDRLSGHPPLHFDLSVFDMFAAFASGAELHLVPPGLNVLPNKLADWIRDSRVTQWFSVPSALVQLAGFDALAHDGLPNLKRVLWCGEVLPTPALRYCMQRLPRATFTNLYGPTEATIASSYYTVPECPRDDAAPIPIGAPCEGEELLVLDHRFQPVAPGTPGDLYIGGLGLSPGYWNDADQTARAYLRIPDGDNGSKRIYRTGDRARVGPDGEVYFLGRADSQIKSRGYRIELGEIEAAFNSLPSVRECAVVAVPSNSFAGAEICCAYVPAANSESTPVSLKQELKSLVPGYMVPSRWIEHETLPRNPNGKIDRRKLKEAMEQDAVTTD